MCVIVILLKKNLCRTSRLCHDELGVMCPVTFCAAPSYVKLALLIFAAVVVHGVVRLWCSHY